MTAGTRYNLTRTLPTAADRQAEFARQDRFETRVFWFSVSMAALTVAAWIVALV